MRPPRARRRALRTVPLIGVVAAVLLSSTPATAAPSHAPIVASGSSWAANAINQWVADVASSGLKVTYTASGSAQGRKDFSFNTTDFSQSEIGYQGFDPLTGESDTAGNRAFAYMPIVSGGTAFPYQIRVRGQLVRDLRLSGTTLVKIFTNQITNWSDPAITADNNGRVLPSLPIVPVVHSEGAGATAHMTDYFDKQFPNIWRPFFGRSGFTEYFPRKGQTIAQSGSDGVMNFVASAAGNGSIGYDEYSYPKMKSWPSAKIGNAAGYYTLPTQYNVAVALTKAIINQDRNSPDYLLQNLDNVYTFNDPRTYPLSSYSYTILPTGADDPKFVNQGDDHNGTAKRQTLADFLYYSLCEGQKEVGAIGYSSLPVNLVQASIEQVGKLKAADPGVDLTQRDVSTCHNPTFVPGEPSRNYLAEIAPLPPACDNSGQGPCADTAAGPGVVAVPGAAGGSSGGSNKGGAATGGSGAKGGAATASGATATGEAAADGSVAVEGAVADAATADGQAVEEAAAAGGRAVGVAAIGGSDEALPAGLVPLVVLLLAFVAVAPPLLYRRFGRRPGEAR